MEGKNKKLYGFVGLRRSGKDTAAAALVADGYELVKFAGALKEMLRTYLRYVGADEEYVEKMIEGEMKEMSSCYFGGKSARFAMQTLGTEWGRDIIYPNLWVNACLDRVKQFEKVTVSDVRFPNEVDALHSFGGKIIRITRPGVTAESHISEALTDSLQADFDVINDGTIDELQQKVLQLISHE